ncbi:MAG: ABC transporter ATP-binding protein [Nevskiaceae bacterium]|nr:MAG: ABC transporter ATP-binding protein [Nevskiaceae bacterium]
MSALLEARALVKEYPKVRAVDGVSFEVPAGICFGLLGPNGAGKSTTIELLEGVAKPSGGEVLFRGESIAGGTSRYREKIGIQFQSTALQDFLTVRENLRLFQALYPKKRPLDELIAVCRLEEFLDRDSHKLSGGQRQRVLLAIALVNDPELVFLDEPTTGLDPQARRNFWELVRSIKAEGKTLVLTTHYMEEAYALCDDIGIMDHGRLIARGSPQRLLAEHFDDSVLELPAADALRAGSELPFVLRGDWAELSTRDIAGALAILQKAGTPLDHLRIRPRTLEDLFLELTGKELRA